MSDDKIDTIPVYLKWVSVQPDKRQWKPAMPVLEPSKVMVVIDVPKSLASGSYKENEDEDKYTGLILTPAGMRYVIDKLEEVMSEVKVKDLEELIEWEDEEKEIEWNENIKESESDDEEWE